MASVLPPPLPQLSTFNPQRRRLHRLAQRQRAAVWAAAHHWCALPACPPACLPPARLPACRGLAVSALAGACRSAAQPQVRPTCSGSEAHWLPYIYPLTHSPTQTHTTPPNEQPRCRWARRASSCCAATPTRRTNTGCAWAAARCWSCGGRCRSRRACRVGQAGQGAAGSACGGWCRSRRTRAGTRGRALGLRGGGGRGVAEAAGLAAAGRWCSTTPHGFSLTFCLFPPCCAQWQHSVPRRQGLQGERISLTFRRIMLPERPGGGGGSGGRAGGGGGGGGKGAA